MSPIAAPLPGDELERAATIQSAQVEAQTDTSQFPRSGSSPEAELVSQSHLCWCFLHNDLPFGSHITITVFIYAKQHFTLKKKETHHHWPNPSLEYNAQALGTPRVEPAAGLVRFQVCRPPRFSSYQLCPRLHLILPNGDNRGALWQLETGPLGDAHLQEGFSF